MSYTLITANRNYSSWSLRPWLLMRALDIPFEDRLEQFAKADNYDEFKKLGAEVYGVSTDTHFTHKAWHDTSDTIAKIQYPILGDPTLEISKSFDILREGQGLADRGTFLVDPDGVIQFTEVTAEGIGRNAAELLRKVKAAQYVRSHPGEVCPAKWEEGAETLAPSLDLVGKI